MQPSRNLRRGTALIAVALLAVVVFARTDASAQTVGDHITTERLAVINGCGQAWATEEPGAAFQPVTTRCQSAHRLDLALDRIGYLNDCGALIVTQGRIGGLPSMITGCDDVAQFELSGNRLALTNYGPSQCEALYVREGNAALTPIAGCGATADFALSPNRLPVVNECGQVWVRQGALLTAPFRAVNGCGATGPVAVADNGVAVVSPCGQLFVSRGAANAGLTPITKCGQATAVAMSPNRVVIANECQALYVKEGNSVTAPWQNLAPCGGGYEVSVTDERIAIVNHCGQLWTQTGLVTNPLTPNGGCDGNRWVALGDGDQEVVVPEFIDGGTVFGTG